MTKQEFTNRTMVEVSNYEFDAINEVYMHSDLDKDQFCKMWCKMNATRVKNAKVDLMLKQRDEAYRESLHRWFEGWNNNPKFIDNWCTPIAYTKISTYEIAAMSHAGILLNDTLLHIHHKVGEYLGIYNN